MYYSCRKRDITSIKKDQMPIAYWLWSGGRKIGRCGADVREIWNDILEENRDLRLHSKVDGKRLYEHLFYDEREWNKNEIKELLKT